MRILTVRQPWAWQIINEGKGVENRSTNIAGDYRGDVAIHAALKADEPALAALPIHAPSWVPRVFEYGAIIGVVRLWAVHRANMPRGRAVCCPDDDRYQQWAFATGWHLCVTGPRRLREPIPYRGALGMRTLPEHVAADIYRRTA